MVLSQLAEHFYATPTKSQESHDDPLGTRPAATTMQEGVRGRQEEILQPDTGVKQLESESEYRPPYLHAMVAGGVGGIIADMLTHSLDTVKTRQQGDPHMPPKYTALGNTYYTILKQEGVFRGLYGGVAPAFWGSLSSAVLFFGAYEWSKRFMLDHGVAPTMAYFSAGFAAELAISPIYVPTEVVKTRLQLQGRYNNPYFNSGYNYRNTFNAIRTIYRTEGLAEFFSGYKATICRDLPFSALQFLFYEQSQQLAKKWVGPGNDIGLGLEILTGASAGGMAGVLTCPMDVVKTRIQTELDPEVAEALKQKKQDKRDKKLAARSSAPSLTATATQRPSPLPAQAASQQRQQIATLSPSTTLRRHGHISLDTESVVKGLRIIYRTEGFAGWFRGVGPKFVWTAMQSGTMLLVYQKMLKYLAVHPIAGADEEGLRGFV